MELYRCGYCGEWAQYDELLHLPAGAIHGVCYHEWLQEELEAIDYRILVNAR